MNMKEMMVISALALGGASAMALAQDQGSGRVAMTGSVISTQPPCVLAPDSMDQIFNLGQIADSALLANNGTGKSSPQAFSIRLDMCDVSVQDTVNVTFTGVPGKDGRLAITGMAAGASVGINDASGQALPIGMVSKSFKLQNGSNTLSFSTYLQGDGVPENIKPGDYYASVNFALSYQ